jgi:hypothetical protein
LFDWFEGRNWSLWLILSLGLVRYFDQIGLINRRGRIFCCTFYRHVYCRSVIRDMHRFGRRRSFNYLGVFNVHLGFSRYVDLGFGRYVRLGFRLYRRRTAATTHGCWWSLGDGLISTPALAFQTRVESRDLRLRDRRHMATHPNVHLMQ